MSADTYDVFEYSQEHGGYAGVRTFRDHNYSHKNDPEVIAMGVTFEEAQNLVSCTPEVSRLTATVEKAFCRGANVLDLMILKHEIFNALFAITEDRRRRDENGLEPSGEFISFESIDDSTLKNRIIKAVLKAFPDPLGNVGNLDLAGKRFLITVVSSH